MHTRKGTFSLDQNTVEALQVSDSTHSHNKRGHVMNSWRNITFRQSAHYQVCWSCCR